MSLREAAEAILKSVEGEMSSAYNRAHAVCCGRPGMECCGSPEPEWDEADQLVMDTLAPVQRALRAALANADRRKPCTCHDTSRGPGRPCAVKSGNALGELWRCVEEAEAPKAEPETGTYLDQIAEAKRDMEQWPEWMKPEWMKGAPVPPKAEPVSEDPMIEAAWKRFTAELENPSPLTDEEILEMWSPSLDGSVQRPILGKNKIIAFARAVLAAARGK